MPWFKVDDNFAFHAKAVAAGNPAVGLWSRAGAWCAQQLTDGFVPDHILTAIGTKAQADKLVAVGLWKRVEGGHEFHEWHDRQPSRVDVEADRAAAKERMRVARENKRKATQSTKPQVSGSRSGEHERSFAGSSGEVSGKFGDPEFGNPDPTRPDPTRPIPPTEVSTSADADAAPKPSNTLAVLDRPDVERICTHLADRIEANGAKRPDIGKTWHDAARLLMDRDGRSEQDIHAAIDWCQTHEFWRGNVLSMPKLREKYDTLRLQAQRKGATATVRRGDIDWEAAAQRAADRDAREAM